MPAGSAPPIGRPSPPTDSSCSSGRWRTPDLDFLDHDAVVRAYYPECAAVVRAATGAVAVAAFDHNIRSATGKTGKLRIAGGQEVQGPAHLVHGDYTLTSAPQRLRESRAPPDPERHLSHGARRGRGASRRRGGRTGDWGRALRDRQRLAQHRPRTGGDPAACPLRCGERAPGRARRVRDPLRGSRRRELLREARCAPPLGLLVRHDPRRGAAHQAVGTRRASWPAPGARGPTPTPTAAAVGPAPSASTAPSRTPRPRPTRRTAGASRCAAPRCSGHEEPGSGPEDLRGTVDRSRGLGAERRLGGRLADADSARRARRDRRARPDPSRPPDGDERSRPRGLRARRVPPLHGEGSRNA